MKVAFIADVHVGNHQYSGGPLVAGVNSRCESVLKVLAAAVDKAADMGCGQLVVLGDLFDTVRPNPQTITQVRGLFEQAQLDIALLIGNHDRNSSVAGDHALGPLYKVSGDGVCIDVIERPTTYNLCGKSAIMLPFNDAPVAEWFEATLLAQLSNWDRNPSDHASYPTAVCVHFGLYDSALAQAVPWVREAKDAAPVEWVASVLMKHGIKHLFAGNWHTYQSWTIAGVKLTQVGALVPTGFDNPGQVGYGGLVVFDTETGEYSIGELPGPRFIKILSIEEWKDLCLDVSVAPEALPEVHVSWTCQPGESSVPISALEELQVKQASQATWLKSFRVLPDPKAASVFLQQTANVARQASTVAELTAKFMAEYQLPEGCRREVVQAHVIRFLGVP